MPSRADRPVRIVKRRLLISRLAGTAPVIFGAALLLFALWPWIATRGPRRRTIVFYGFSILGDAMNDGIFPAFQKSWLEETGETRGVRRLLRRFGHRHESDRARRPRRRGGRRARARRRKARRGRGDAARELEKPSVHGHREPDAVRHSRSSGKSEGDPRFRGPRAARNPDRPSGSADVPAARIGRSSPSTAPERGGSLNFPRPASISCWESGET